MLTAVAAAFTAILGYFTEVFELITSPAVVPWVSLGIGISLLGVCAKFVRKLIWGM